MVAIMPLVAETSATNWKGRRFRVSAIHRSFPQASIVISIIEGEGCKFSEKYKLCNIRLPLSILWQ